MFEKAIRRPIRRPRRRERGVKWEGYWEEQGSGMAFVGERERLVLEVVVVLSRSVRESGASRSLALPLSGAMVARGACRCHTRMYEPESD